MCSAPGSGGRGDFSGVPVLVMTYWNPVDHYGVAAFARDLAEAGGSGLITPDLPPEEAGEWLDAAARYSLEPVRLLVAPSSSQDRVKLISSVCGGFVYAASVMGITYARSSVGDAAARPCGQGQAAHQAAGSCRAWREQRCAGGTGRRVRRWCHRGLGLRAAAAQRRQRG